MTDLALLYEHPTWFQPLFAALDRRGIGYLALHADGHAYDPADTTPLAGEADRRVGGHGAWEEEAVMGPAEPLDQAYPGATIVLEFGEPLGVKPIPHFAYDRGGLHAPCSSQKPYGSIGTRRPSRQKLPRGAP